jgi:tetratricopeptide (TPR) repeat protein
MRLLLLVVGLGFAQWWIAPAEPPRRTAALSERFPAAVGGVFLGAFQPVLLQYLWWDFEVASTEGRYEDVLTNLRLLQELEPENGRAVVYLAGFVAHTLGGLEGSPLGRLGRIGDAVDLLRAAEARIPKDPALPRMRGLILTNPFVWDDLRLYAAYTTRRGRTPFDEAVEAFGRAWELDRKDRNLAMQLADALRMRGLEQLLAEKDPKAAHGTLTRAREILPGDGTLGRQRLMADAGIVAGLAEKRLRALLEGLSELRAVLATLSEGEGVEDALAMAILLPALKLGAELAGSEAPDAILSLLVSVHNILPLLEGRLGLSQDSVQSAEVRGGLRVLARLLTERAPHLEEHIPDPWR